MSLCNITFLTALKLLYSLYHFYDGLWYDPATMRTQDLLSERQTCLPLSQPNTVPLVKSQPYFINLRCYQYFSIYYFCAICAIFYEI